MASSSLHVSFSRLLVCVALASGVLSQLRVLPAQEPTPPVADRLPEQTVAYLRIRNTSELVDRLQQTALGLAFQDPQVRPLIEHLWSSVVPTLEQFEAKMGMGVDELAKAAPGQLVVALVSVPERPAAGLLMFQPDRPEELDQTLERGGGRLQEFGYAPSSETVGGAEVRILAREDGPFDELIQMRLDDWRIITTDREVAAAMIGLAQGEPIPSLSDFPAFRTIMARCTSPDNKPQLDWYVDPLGTARAVTRGNLAAAAAMAMLPTIGADGLQAIGGRAAFADGDYDSIFRSYVLLEPPRDGVLKLLALQQGSSDPEPWVPADVAGYSTWHIDFRGAFATLQEVVDRIRGEGALSGMVKRYVSDRLGVDFEQELLPLLAGRATQIVRFEQPISLTSQTSGFGIEVTDGQKLRKPLADITAKYADRIEKSSFAGVELYQWSGRSDNDAPPQDANDAERPRSRASAAPPRPVAAILGNYLLISDRMSLMQQMIRTFQGDQPRLDEELDYKLIVGKLKGHAALGASMIGFNRPDEGWRYMYQLLQTDEVRQRLHEQRDKYPFFRALDEMVSENRLPPFDIFAQYLAPGGTMLVNEESGLQYVSFGLRRKIDPSLSPLR